MSYRSLLATGIFAFAALPALTAAQQPGSATGPGVRVDLPSILRYREVAAVAPGGRLGEHVDPGWFAAQWAARTRDGIRQARIAINRTRLLTGLGQFGVRSAGARRRFNIAAPPAAPRGRDRQSPLGVVAEVAQLGIQMRSRIEMQFDRLKNERCTAFEFGQAFSGCEAGFPAPSLDQQFQVAAGGIVSQRVNINVDFDTEREFDSNNDIRVFYQGLDDEVLRRVEVGNVRFRTPSSRFIASGVGGNSFGFLGEAEIGPVSFRGIIAQQKGSSVRTRTFQVGDEVRQPAGREILDLEWETSRFFSVVDPRTLPGYPDLDVLNLDPAGLGSGFTISAVRVYRLRALGGLGTGNDEEGAIDAVAVRDDSDQKVGPFRWELLVEGRDYYLDPSRLWFGMNSRLGSREFLAVSYVTAAGDTIGTFPDVGGAQDTLFLIHEPERGTEVPTFFHELRNFYRVGGSDVDPSSVKMSIVVNASDRPLSGVGTYLSELGMSQTNDRNTLDNFNRVFPRDRDPNRGAPISDFFVVFPHYTPFADSTRLQEAERNDSLYLTPTYLRDTQGPPSTLSMLFDFESTGGGNRSGLSLGALGIQPGSERVSVGSRRLRRDIDYEISYQTGEITFFNPDSLFPGPARVRIDFEEEQQFDSDAKSLLGFAATYDLGSVGHINAVALSQSERTQLLRPQLGFEPEASFVGGVSTSLDFRLDRFTRILDGLPLLETQVPSRLTFNGELAMSRPNPNRGGVAFVEDFEGTGGSSRTIRLNENLFQLGSAPSTGDGIDSRYLNAGVFADVDAVPLIWQNLIQVGFDALSFSPSDIDSTIVTVGSARETETVLWMTMKPDTLGGAPDPVTGQARWLRPHTPGPRWRSISQPLGTSGLGVDLSRAEFLEFWVLEDAQRTARANDAVLIFDLGTVFEDAVAPAPDRFSVSGTDTTFAGLQFVGTGVLDTERDTITNTFNAAFDDIGIHDDLLKGITNSVSGEVLDSLALCTSPLAVGIPVFPRGDLGTGCTRRNGLMDTEDLDGDNRLDRLVGRDREDLFRYVFPIGDEGHFVRDGGTLLDASGGNLQWRLYRIPLRNDSVQVGRPNIRQIRSLRITMVTPDRGPGEEEVFIALARMQLIGAPWVKRAGEPLTGIEGVNLVPRGEVIASVVSTENAADLGYTSPPGIFNNADRAGAGLNFGTQQINEKSLRLLARDLRDDERAEAFLRFTDNSDKSFLKYNTLRVWARGRGDGWVEGDLEFYIKVGRDENNFYMYRTPVNTDTWEPEVNIDLNRWLDLRTQIESRWLRGDTASGSAECGGDPLAFVACDGNYVVHVRDPGVAPPNLARVSEVAVGILRVDETINIPEAELWVDDIRLDDVVDDPGFAGAFDARFAAADVGDVTWSVSRKDDQFRQLGQDPTYVADNVSSLGASLRVDKFLPRSWGMNIPVTANFNNTSSDPFFLNRSDILASGISNLRKARNSSSFYQFSIRRERRGDSFLEKALLDPLSVFAQFQSSESSQLLSESNTRNRQMSVRYNQVSDPRTVPAVPGFIKGIVGVLPGFIRNSEFGRGLRTSRLRWNPVQFGVTSTLVNNRSSRRSFRVPVALPGDSIDPGSESLVKTWLNQASIDFRPFPTFNVRVQYSSTRDLQNYGDSTSVGRLLQRERRSLRDVNIGFVRASSFRTQLNMQPVVSRWLRPTITFNSNFNFNRNPNARDPVRVDGDTLGEFRLPETVSNSRRQDYRAALDVPALTAGVFGDSSFVARVFKGVRVADLAYTITRRSSFDRFPFEASTRYRLGFGGLDNFLQQDGVLATSASEEQTWTASGGTSFLLGTRVDMNYSETNRRTFTLRGGDQSEVVENTIDWPTVNFSWTYSPGSIARRVISNISASVTYRRSETNTRLPGTVAIGDTGRSGDRFSRRNSIRPNLTLSWGLGITTAVSFSRSTVDSRVSGSLNQSTQNNWTGSVAFSLKPPRSLVRLNSPILTRINFNQFTSEACVQRAGQDECATVADATRSTFGLTMDTGFSPTVRGGANFAYTVTEQKTLSSKFSQITFSIFAQINFFAGQLR